MIISQFNKNIKIETGENGAVLIILNPNSEVKSHIVLSESQFRQVIVESVVYLLKNT